MATPVSSAVRVDEIPAVMLPGSKSIAARALICRAVLSPGTRIEGLPDCDDTLRLDAALTQLLGAPGVRSRVDVGAGGTSLRFLLALAASLPGIETELRCDPQLARRPIGPLLDALRMAGADIECLGGHDIPPLRVRGRKLRGGVVRMDPSVSSQFISALMMASPLWESAFMPDYGGRTPVSAPYIEMTRSVMDVFRTRPDVFRVEADWSAASYFYEYALLHPGSPVRIANLNLRTDSLQGDARVKDIFAVVGVESRPDGAGAILWSDPGAISSFRDTCGVLTADMTDTPDLVPALVVAFCVAGIRFRFSGVAHLRHKESNRIAALSEEMAKAGFLLRSDSDSIFWTGHRTEVKTPAVFSSHDDHRIAMSLMAAADRLPVARVEGLGAIAKSFPAFLSQLRLLAYYSDTSNL